MRMSTIEHVFGTLRRIRFEVTEKVNPQCHEKLKREALVADK